MQKSGPGPEQAETNERNETIVSASKEHKKELELERQRQREEQAKAERKSMALYGVIAAVVAVFAVAMLVLNSGVLQRSVAAVTVNDTKFTAADMQYYYNMEYATEVGNSQTYAMYGMPYNFDYTVDPAKQVYNAETGETWEDFFVESAKQSAVYLTAVTDAAKQAGHTLSQEALDTREAVVKNMDTVWVGSYNSRSDFLRANYGSYMTYDRLEFREDNLDNNLTAIIAFYAYLIIGLDMDTMGELGGTEFLNKAQNIASGAQSLGGTGWQSGTSTRNRFTIIDDYMNTALLPVRQMMYSYHRKGFDIMFREADKGRAEIAKSLELLQSGYQDRPLSYFPKLFTEYKQEELINIFSQGPAKERKQAVEILTEINPSLTSSWDKISTI